MIKLLVENWRRKHYTSKEIKKTGVYSMKYTIRILIGFFAFLFVGLVGAGFYFYNYAIVPSEKSFITHQDKQSLKKLTTEEEWFRKKQNRTDYSLTSYDGLKLKAIYLAAEHKTTKNVIMAHGYTKSAEDMASFAKMYHDLGYNVLIPDARGHGKSEGNYIGFGWHERKDYLQWINKLITINGEDAQITLYGISMGGATVMMTSGEPLPKNVKAIVEDCGYTSAKEELSDQLKKMFHLPSFPLIPITSLITKLKAGYFFGEANALTQLKKNKLPILFIHGKSDTFVPFSMLEKVYQATSAPKEKYIVSGAEHAESYQKNPKQYKTKVAEFLKKYIID